VDDYLKLMFIDLKRSERNRGSTPKSEVINRESKGANTAGLHMALNTAYESNDGIAAPKSSDAHVAGVPGVMMQELPASAHAIWTNVATSSTPANFSLLHIFVIYVFLFLMLVFEFGQIFYIGMISCIIGCTTSSGTVR